MGPYEACPYCGARGTGRLPIRVVKAVAVGLAVVGLSVLWPAAVRSSIPRLPIGQIGATMNMAYARVEGQVVRGPNLYPDSGALAFTLADDTGQIRVSAYRSEVEAMRDGGRIPALGDRVSVAGTLRVREEGLALTVNVADHVEVLRPEAVEVEVGDISPSDRLLRVRLRGQVWAVRQPYPGLTLVTLRDRSGAIDVVVDTNLEALHGGWAPPAVGQSLEVVGTVDLYRDAPQIVPASLADIALLPVKVPVAFPITAAGLSADDVDHLVVLEGRVTRVDRLSAGVRLALEDGSGEVEVFLWQELVDGLPQVDCLRSGALLRVLGRVALYRGELELVVERSTDVIALEGVLTGGEGLPAPANLIIGELGPAWRSEMVSVEGQVIAASSFSGGFKFVVDDGSGQIALLLWRSVYDELAGASDLDVGARVRVAGVVDDYEGELQVVPASAEAIAVLAPGLTRPSPRDVGSLAGADVGSLMTVEGAVVQVERFSGGQRGRLGDGTGEVTVILWDSLDCSLAPGAWLRVTGVVETYRGELELVPRLPHDVVFIGEE